MKKRKMFCVFLSMVLIFFVLLISSNFFCVKTVNVVCSSNTKKNMLFSDEKTIDYGCFYNKTMLFSNLMDNKNIFEQINPKYKLVDIKKIFPNHITITVLKRDEQFYVCDDDNYFVLDGEFKILSVLSKENVETTNLIEIGSQDKNYFEYFDIFSCTYIEGVFLNNNNVLFNYLTNLYNIVNNFSFFENIKKVEFVESDEKMNLQLITKNNFGVKLIIENIESEFDYKLTKILNAVITLEKNEKIKTTYGNLAIDNNKNCKWMDN